MPKAVEVPIFYVCPDGPSLVVDRFRIHHSSFCVASDIRHNPSLAAISGIAAGIFDAGCKIARLRRIAWPDHLRHPTEPIAPVPEKQFFLQHFLLLRGKSINGIANRKRATKS